MRGERGGGGGQQQRDGDNLSLLNSINNNCIETFHVRDAEKQKYYPYFRTCAICIDAIDGYCCCYFIVGQNVISNRIQYTIAHIHALIDYSQSFHLFIHLNELYHDHGRRVLFSIRKKKQLQNKSSYSHNRAYTR